MSIRNPAKCETRAVIRFLLAEGKTPIEIFTRIKTVYGEGAMNRTNVFKWCREFNEGRTNIHDEQTSGRPSIVRSMSWCKKSTKLFVGTTDWQWTKCLQCFHKFSDLCYMKQLQKLWEIENCLQDGSQNNWQSSTNWIGSLALASALSDLNWMMRIFWVPLWLVMNWWNMGGS